MADQVLHLDLADYEIHQRGRWLNLCCQGCGIVIAVIEDGSTLDVMVGAALKHERRGWECPRDRK